jgi:hypothetical protein
MAIDVSEKRPAYIFGIYLGFLNSENSENKHQQNGRTSWPVEKA